MQGLKNAVPACQLGDILPLFSPCQPSPASYVLCMIDSCLHRGCSTCLRWLLPRVFKALTCQCTSADEIPGAFAVASSCVVRVQETICQQLGSNSVWNRVLGLSSQLSLLDTAVNQPRVILTVAIALAPAACRQTVYTNETARPVFRKHCQVTRPGT